MPIRGLFRKTTTSYKELELGELRFDPGSSLWEGSIPFPDARKRVKLAARVD